MSPFEIAAANFLVHLGFAVGALAYILRDILWLRLVAAGSYAIFAVFAVGRGPDTVWTLVPWYAAFITINVAHAALIFYQRCIWRFTAAEAALHSSAFPTLSRPSAKRLMRSGTWKTLSIGDVLTHEGTMSKRVYLIASGRVQVTLQRKPVVELGAGKFVGEIGLIARRSASATATALPDADGLPPRVLLWDVARLRRRLREDDELRSAMETAIGADLARKIADQNVSIGRQCAELCPEPDKVPNAA